MGHVNYDDEIKMKEIKIKEPAAIDIDVKKIMEMAQNNPLNPVKEDPSGYYAPRKLDKQEEYEKILAGAPLATKAVAELSSSRQGKELSWEGYNLIMDALFKLHKLETVE